MNTPRRFALRRDEDFSGVSGTGYVAYGVEFTDGHVAMRWDTHTRSTAIYESIEHLERIHAHGGMTTVEWIDDVPNPPGALESVLRDYFKRRG